MTLTAEGPRVVDRRFLGVRNGQPYHLARSHPLARAEAIIREAEEQCAARALEGVRGILDAVGRVTRAGIVMSAYELPRTLAATLRSHPACHAAEGQMTRDALVSACESLGLRVVGALASR